MAEGTADQEPGKEEPVKEDVLSILDEIKSKLETKKGDNVTPPASQPSVSNDRRKAFMEASKMTEDQVRLIESGQVADQRIALMEVKADNKDYALLAKDFEGKWRSTTKSISGL